MPRNLIIYALLVLVTVAVAGVLGKWLGTGLTFNVPEKGQTLVGAFWERFQVMFLIAVMIEPA